NRAEIELSEPSKPSEQECSLFLQELTAQTAEHMRLGYAVLQAQAVFYGSRDAFQHILTRLSGKLDAFRSSDDLSEALYAAAQAVIDTMRSNQLEPGQELSQEHPRYTS